MAECLARPHPSSFPDPWSNMVALQAEKKETQQRTSDEVMHMVPAQLCFNDKAIPGNFDSTNSNFHPDPTLNEAEIIELEECAGEVAIKTNGEVKPCGINGVDWSGIIHVTLL